MCVRALSLVALEHVMDTSYIHIYVQVTET